MTASLTPKALWRNTLTVAGAVLAVVTMLFILSFLWLDLAMAQPSPYIGLFTYLIFPGLLVVATAMISVGLLAARFRFRRQYGRLSDYQFYPRIDLNDPRHRRLLATTGAAIALTVPVIGVLSYEGYHYTDSNQFCGAVCHTVMEPQFTAFQQSPHAHITCAECHIGAGASWYVKSKLSGIRQVVAVAADSFPRPIPPAIQELRPATETCRQCHWPSKFYGDQLVTIDHYSSDEANTHGRIRMLLKTGGSDPSTGPPSGIHWHMALGFTVEYVAVDDHLQEIPWVQTTDHTTGDTRVYRSDGRPHSDPPPQGTRRTVDCMDCHNRPTHIFRSPQRAADSALNVNPGLQNLPFAKRQLVGALAQPHADREQGLTQISNRLEEFYQKNYPAVWSEQRVDVEKLIEVGHGILRTTSFPEMKVSWRTYPDNIGHKIFPGCFRCHEGRHVDELGKALSHECGTCHEFLMPAGGDGASPVVRTGGFVHPVPLEGNHGMMRCDQCHTGGNAPERTCAGCHILQAGFRAGNAPVFRRFTIAPDPMAEAVDCEGCHVLSKPTTIAAIDERCMDCHSDDEDRYKGMLRSWKTEIDAMLLEAESVRDPETVDVLHTLRKAGPLHNVEGARTIVRALSVGAGTTQRAPEPVVRP